jgi:hypothetical protein
MIGSVSTLDGQVVASSDTLWEKSEIVTPINVPNSATKILSVNHSP